MIVKLQEREYRKLKAKERAVKEIEQTKDKKDQFNFIASHVLIGAGLIVTIMTRVF